MLTIPNVTTTDETRLPRERVDGREPRSEREMYIVTFD